MRVEWKDNLKTLWVSPDGNKSNIRHDWDREGIVVGVTRKWFQIYLLVYCSDNIFRKVKPAKVKVVESASHNHIWDRLGVMQQELMGIKPDAQIIYSVLHNKLNLIIKHFDMMATPAPKIEFEKRKVKRRNKAK